MLLEIEESERFGLAQWFDRWWFHLFLFKFTPNLGELGLPI